MILTGCVCVSDANSGKSDPTGTGPIRRSLFSTLSIRWRRVRVAVRAGILNQDILGLGSVGASATMAVHGASKIDILQRWLDAILEGSLLQGTNDVDQSLTKAYDRGFEAGSSMLGPGYQTKWDRALETNRIGILVALSRVELQGIAEAVSQNAIRTVGQGLLNNDSRNKILAQINKAIDSIGLNRTGMMVEYSVVKAFNDAVLDAFESVGVESVGLIPEVRAKGRMGVGDSAAIADLRTKKKSKTRRATGPGSRVPRNRTPSLRTIQRIRAVEKQFAKTPWVKVETAEDEDVCEICLGIADYGPYRINVARTLIPAHPRCRCTFIPTRKPRNQFTDGGCGKFTDLVRCFKGSAT